MFFQSWLPFAEWNHKIQNMQSMFIIARAVCGLLAAAMLYFLLIYFQGDHWMAMYGTWPHSASRFHPLLVHCSVGIVLIYFYLEAYDGYSVEKISAVTKKTFYYFSHFFLLLSLMSGLVMEMIERYPNEHINEHLIWAIAGYLFFAIMPLLLQFLLSKKLTYLFLIGIAAAIFINVARLGALVYKGSGFFH